MRGARRGAHHVLRQLLEVSVLQPHGGDHATRREMRDVILELAISRWQAVKKTVSIAHNGWLRSTLTRTKTGCPTSSCYAFRHFNLRLSRL